MKNICRRCGDCVGHRGSDLECPSCQYLIKLEKVRDQAKVIISYKYKNLTDEQSVEIKALKKLIKSL